MAEKEHVSSIENNGFRSIPDNAHEVTGKLISHGEEIGQLGFRGHKVQIGKQFIDWPASWWDKERKVYWGFNGNDVVIWKGKDPLKNDNANSGGDMHHENSTLPKRPDNLLGNSKT